MKLAPIVALLQKELPQYTPLFTDALQASLSWAGAVVTATFTEPHGLLAGHEATLSGVREDVAIASMTRSSTPGDTQAVIVTTQVHDHTFDRAAGTSSIPINPLTRNGQVTISGAAEADWNGTFDVDPDGLDGPIPDRNTINIIVPPYVAQATSVTGSPVLEEAYSPFASLNRAIVVVTSTDLQITFNMETAHIGQPQPAGTILVNSRPRVSSAVTVRKALEHYTEEADQTKLWAYVVLGDNTSGTSRENDSDAVAEQRRGAWQQRLLQPMSVLVVFPASDSVTGSDERDLAEDIRGALMSSLLGAELETGLATDLQAPGSAGKPQLQYQGDGVFVYDGALLVHEYSFIQTATIGNRDTIKPSADVAYRDSNITIFPVLDLLHRPVFDESVQAKVTLTDWSHDDRQA